MISCRTDHKCCWICGSSADLTGEHKIKKSDLRKYPQTGPLILKADGKKDSVLQGVNAKLLKFPESICKKCNNEATQRADRSYDRFMKEELDIVDPAKGVQPENLNAEDRVLSFEYRPELERYFGKHLGCALRYQRFPVPRRLSRFVAAKSSKTCLLVIVRRAPLWFQSESGEISPLFGLGGAFIKFHPSLKGFPGSYVSAFMTSGVQFVVSMRLNIIEGYEVRRYVDSKDNFTLKYFSDDEAEVRGIGRQ